MLEPCQSSQPITFLFLSSSRALPDISMSLRGYPSLKHSNIASVAICLYFLLTFIRYCRAVWPLTKYIVDNFSSKFSILMIFMQMFRFSCIRSLWTVFGMMITSLCNSQCKATCAAVLPYFSPIWVRVGLDQVLPDKHHNPVAAFPRHCLTLSLP